jgi:aryl sulfotransferase
MQAIGSPTQQRPPAAATSTPVLHISYIKSGSYFLWQALDLLFRAHGSKRSFVQAHPIQRLRGKSSEFSIEQFDIDQMLIQDEAAYWQIEVQHLEEIRDLRAYLQACSHIWTHSFLCERSWEVYPRCGRVCYIVRDPRDALVSMAHFVQTPYMRRYHPHDARSPTEYVTLELTRFLEDWCRHAGDHWRARHALQVHFLQYERMVAELPQQLASLAKWAGLQLPPESIAQVAERLSLKNMRGQNPQHVRRGGSGGFAELLDASQQRRALEICGETMRELGYEV